jgi:Na+/melibiose symporter-like transporter
MRPSVSFATKTAFGVGQVAEGVKNASFNLFLLFYYTNVLGLSGTQTGVALFVATALDAVTDPLAGSLSDRLRHRWGRRHPLMYAAAIPLALSFGLLFAPPRGLSETGLFLWLLGFAVLVRSAMTLYHVPHLALGAELSGDYGERTTIVAFRSFFGLVGMAVAVGSAWLFFFRPTPGFETGQLNPAVYPAYGWLFGAVMAAAILASAWGTHARIPQLPRAPDDLPPFDTGELVRDYRRALANASFRAIFVGVVVFFVMRGVQEVLQVHMGTYFWLLDQRQIFATSAAAVAGYLLGIPCWSLASRRLDKKPTFLAGVGVFSVCVLTPPVAKLVDFYPPAESPLYLGLLLLASGLAAFAAAAGVVMAGSMLADVADEHELENGRRQEGVLFGALAFAGKSSSGLGSLLGGVGLDLIRFPTRADPLAVAPETVTALGILAGPGLGVLALLAVLILSGYRIDRRRHAEVAAALAARRDHSR